MRRLRIRTDEDCHGYDWQRPGGGCNVDGCATIATGEKGEQAHCKAEQEVSCETHPRPLVVAANVDDAKNACEDECEASSYEEKDELDGEIMISQS